MGMHLFIVFAEILDIDYCSIILYNKNIKNLNGGLYEF